MLVDTHCHLTFSPLADDLEGVMARARRARVEKVICCAYDVGSWSEVARVGKTSGVYTAFGIHPWVAQEGLDRDGLVRALDENDAVVVGEIGLDYKIEGVPRDVQLKVFEEQLAVAVEMDLPVSIHCRGAFEDLLSCVYEHQGRIRGVVHAFSRGPEPAESLIEAGLFLGFGGAITRPGAKRARRAAALIPLDRMVLETDAPSIGLDGVSPEETEPAHVVQVAQALAEIKGVDATAVARQTSSNVKALFNI